MLPAGEESGKLFLSKLTRMGKGDHFLFLFVPDFLSDTGNTFQDGEGRFGVQCLHRIPIQPYGMRLLYHLFAVGPVRIMDNHGQTPAGNMGYVIRKLLCGSFPLGLFIAWNGW